MVDKLYFDVISMLQKAAVITHDKKQRASLEYNLREQYPEVMNAWRVDEMADFEPDEEYDGWSGDVCIAPHIYDNLCDVAQVADAEYWEGQGYVLVDYDELLGGYQDCGDIESYDNDIRILFE